MAKYGRVRVFAAVGAQERTVALGATTGLSVLHGRHFCEKRESTCFDASEDGFCSFDSPQRL